MSGHTYSGTAQHDCGVRVGDEVAVHYVGGDPRVSTIESRQDALVGAVIYGTVGSISGVLGPLGFEFLGWSVRDDRRKAGVT